MTDLLAYLRSATEGRKRFGPVPFLSRPAVEVVDEEAVWQRAVSISQRVLESADRRPVVSFPYGPVCIVNFADWHLGSSGTDYARLEEELTLVRDTPGMFAGFVGDALDNFIIGKLAMLRIDKTPFRVSEEWAMVKRGLGLIASKLLYVVDGNHDQWTYALSGIDYFGEVAEQMRPGVIYARDELLLDVNIGSGGVALRVRHKWRGTSIYNDTHGIERAAKFDKGVAFDIGVGAHTHASGLNREFNNGGKTGLAQLCGTFKRVDGYAIQNGFHRPNQATGVATVMDGSGILFGTTNLQAAAAFMQVLYDDDEQSVDQGVEPGAEN